MFIIREKVISPFSAQVKLKNLDYKPTCQFNFHTNSTRDELLFRLKYRGLIEKRILGLMFPAEHRAMHVYQAYFPISSSKSLEGFRGKRNVHNLSTLKTRCQKLIWGSSNYLSHAIFVLFQYLNKLSQLFQAFQKLRSNTT